MIEEIVDIYHPSKLHQAALNPDVDFARLIQQYDSSAANNTELLRNTPLFAAVSKNNLKALQWYLSSSPDVLQRRNDLGYVPLFWAIDAGVPQNKVVIDVMLSHMDKISQTDKLENNVLHLLVECLTWQEPDSVLNLIQTIHKQDNTLISKRNLASATPLDLAKELDQRLPQLIRSVL